ncbi:MAG: hypothetical protein NTW62_03745 [Candidatus Nomurabacteria bacterium]|nr:hypothetical protein [Candidatus Nomurabacteria bacterium]
MKKKISSTIVAIAALILGLASCKSYPNAQYPLRVKFNSLKVLSHVVHQHDTQINTVVTKDTSTKDPLVYMGQVTIPAFRGSFNISKLFSSRYEKRDRPISNFDQYDHSPDYWDDYFKATNVSFNKSFTLDIWRTTKYGITDSVVKYFTKEQLITDTMSYQALTYLIAKQPNGGRGTLQRDRHYDGGYFYKYNVFHVKRSDNGKFLSVSASFFPYDKAWYIALNQVAPIEEDCYVFTLRE